jgi:5-methylcytosine-specific restriction endonuclease McrA
MRSLEYWRATREAGKPCGCGCGQITSVWRGQVREFIHGHHLKVKEFHSRWKGGTHYDRIPVLGACERCGKQATDRHHKDGNNKNQAAENIVALCRRCHMEVDGRLEQFAEMRGARGRGAGLVKRDEIGRFS